MVGTGGGGSWRGQNSDRGLGGMHQILTRVTKILAPGGKFFININIITKYKNINIWLIEQRKHFNNKREFTISFTLFPAQDDKNEIVNL